MQYSRSLLLPLLVLGACGDNGSDQVDAAVTVDGNDVTTWAAPACAEVSGTGAVTFTHDQGATLAASDTQLVPTTYTFGVVALGRANTLVAASGNDILRSTDAGCTWTRIGDSGDGTMVLVAAGDDRAYGFGDNRTVLARIDGDTVTPLTDPGTPGVVGLGVDPADPDHVRIGDGAGQLWDSTDAGVTWVRIGSPAATETSLAYRAVFDPRDLDHALFGLLGDGVAVSTDPEARWQSATGLAPDGRANGFNLAVSPVDGNVVWAEGLDIGIGDEESVRHVYRSTDGGATFTAVIDEADAILFNGNPLFPDPADADILYFTFGASFQNYGTDIFRYDAGDDSITHTHNAFHRVNAIAFLPGDSSWMWLGLSLEAIN